MVADHWFRQIEKILEAIEITSDTVKIIIAAFQLEGESQVWWDWVKTSRDWEAMTWGDFHELFIGKYFPTSARHAKAQESLELRYGAMIAAFQLEGESQVWWDWVKTSKDWEAMTWEIFHELFIGKYFPTSARHAKAQESLELR